MKKKNITTGIVVIITLVALFFGFNFLKGTNIFNKSRIFYAIYDNVDGLERSNPVIIKGLKAGHVKEIKFIDNNVKQLIVSFTVDGDYKIPKNTKASILMMDIMGGQALDLVFPNKIHSYAVDGDTLQGIINQGLKQRVINQVLPIKEKVDNLMNSLDTVLNATKEILSKNARNSIEKTFSNLESTTKNLKDIFTNEKETIKNILENFSSISQDLEDNKKEITKSIKSTFSQSEKAVSKFSSIIDKLNAGEGTAGALLQDSSLYNKLESTIDNLDRLMTDLRLNPKKYVSFSLLNIGKTIKYDPNAKHKKFYSILLLETTKPIALSNPIFLGRKDITESLVTGNKYHYTIGKTYEYNRLQKILKKVRKDFPQAYIIEVK